MKRKTTNIPWSEFLETYNRRTNSIFSTPKEMVKYLYTKHGSLERAGEVLGVAGPTVGSYLKLWGAGLNKRGHQGVTELQSRYLKLNKKGLANRKIAEMLECSAGYVSYLKNKGGK